MIYVSYELGTLEKDKRNMFSENKQQAIIKKFVRE